MVETTANDRPPSAEPAGVPLALLDRRFDLSMVTAERLVWAGLTLTALISRLLWLESWPLSAGEATVASAIWSLLTRGQATALPAEAGPVVTLLGAISLFFFGATDLTVRLTPALAGAAIVPACWWLRPWLGRAGAGLAAGLLTLSPLFLYQSRRLSGEPVAVLGLLLLLLALLRLRAGGRRPALVLATAALVLTSLSHFLALPIALLLIGLTPVAVIIARGAGPTETGTSLAPPVLARSDWLAALGTGVGLLVAIAILAATGGPELLGNLAAPLTGWLTVTAPAERSAIFVTQLLTVYEPLILIGAIVGAASVGGVRETVNQRLTGLMLVFWAIVGLALAALAGDRGPAQALYPLIPLALLAGRCYGLLLTGIDWAAYWRRRGPVLSAMTWLTVICLLLFLAGLSSPTIGNQQVVLALLYFVLGLLLAVVVLYLAREFGYRPSLRIIAFSLLALLTLYNLRSATQLAYVQPASANEPAVQQQSVPGLLSVVGRIERLSRDLTALRRSESDLLGGYGLEIGYVGTLPPPFEWYLRDYTNRRGLTGPTLTTDLPQVVIVDVAGETALKPLLDRQYVGQRYPLAWSFPNAGVSGDLRALVRFLLYREVAVPATASEVIVYLRRDLVERVLFRGGPTAEAAQPAVNLFDRTGRGRAAGQLDAPRGIAIDDKGNLVVVDTVNARVQKFDAQGNVLWTTGSTGAGPGQFGRVQNGPGPTGVAVDAQGNIYVADTWNHRIVKLDASGRLLTSWGGFFNTQGNQELGRQHPREFFGPRSIAIGPDGALYITDTGNKRVLVFDSDGQPLRQWGGIGSAPEHLNEPVGITVDEQGNVYVADTYNGRIAVFDSRGQPVTQWPVAGWGLNVYQEPYLALAGGTLYVANTLGRSVIQFDRRGNLLAEERRPGGRELVSPTGLAVGPDGAVYVVDTGAHAVVRLK
jgi:uncharacterized protein (TIGR03663 family)